VLQVRSCRPHRLRTALPAEDDQRLRDLLHRSPHDFGKGDDIWSLELVALVCFEQGFTTSLISEESVRRALKRMGINWKRAKRLPHQSRSAVSPKKTARDRLISYASPRADWAIGFLDEVWWSRFALPCIHAWQDRDHPIRLVEQTWQKGDPDPKALACYGVLWQEGTPAQPVRKQMWLRFVTGRPVSAISTQFLDWCCERNWLLIWDNASWHKSKMVRTWIREHNQQVKQAGKGVRILPFLLPTQSPWLNPIEPKWVHGKRHVVQRDGLLSASQLAERVCAYYGCSYEPHLVIPEQVS
jgi:hypothetical protein